MSIEAMKQALEALEGIYIAPENLDYIADWWPACRDSIPALRQAIAEAEKQPTGPATSADRYFYEAGFEAGRLQGIKQERALWELDRIGQEIEAEAEKQEPVANASTWFALVMNAAAELENASHCLRDEDAKRVAIRGAKYYRDQANTLYTHPQPKREPLTFEKVYELWLARFETNEYDDVFMNFARAIEAAHGIKENT
jgi:hypothetical protein